MAEGFKVKLQVEFSAESDPMGLIAEFGNKVIRALEEQGVEEPKFSYTVKEK